MDFKNKKTLVIALTVVAVLLIALALYASQGDGIGAKLGLSSSTANPKTGSGASEDSTPGSKAASPDGEDSGSTGGSASGGSGSSVTPDAKGEKPVMVDTDGDGVEEPALTIKILWWNDTMTNEPKDSEVVFGDSSYKPATGPNDSGSIGPCPIGKKLQLVVYPDGRSGAKLVYEFLLNDEMLGNSERDAIHVEIKDDAVRVLGNPVIDFSQSKDR